MSVDESEIRSVERVLGEPVFVEFDDKTWRIRTNLMLVSLLSVGLVLARLHIEQGSAVLGLRFSGLTDAVLRSGLFAVTCYLLVHFIWAAFDRLLEWKVRITGTRVAFVTTAKLSSEHADYPNNPRNSTLYNWWLGKARDVQRVNDFMAAVESRILELELSWRERSNEAGAAPELRQLVDKIPQLMGEIQRLRTSVENIQKIPEAPRIPVSLKRFDNWFQLFLRSQNLRWFLLDFLFPILLSGYALFLLAA